MFTCGMLGVVSEDSDGPAIHPAEAGDDIFCVERHHLEELTLVNDTWQKFWNLADNLLFSIQILSRTKNIFKL